MMKTDRVVAGWAARDCAGQVRLAGWQLLLLVAVMMAVNPGWSLAAGQAEDIDATVRHLITFVKDSSVTFERNSSRYSGELAAEHISKKYRHFKNEIDTPEKCIELCATGSRVTGKPYYIITRQGEQLPSSEWLSAELSVYRIRNGYGER